MVGDPDEAFGIVIGFGEVTVDCGLELSNAFEAGLAPLAEERFNS